LEISEKHFKNERRRYMELIIFVIGILVGLLLHYVFGERKKPSGAFVMDFRNPTKDICTFELYESIDSIYSKKHIYLQVKTYESDSQQ
jgi:hypothetical protein